jgi:serine/threonine-protein kinase SRPK3
MTAVSKNENAELRNLQSLATQSHSSLGSNSIVQLLDHFTHRSPNGLHQCLVLELLGPPASTVLGDYYSGNDFLPAKVVLKMSRQLLRAISYLHRAGYAHGGMTQNKNLITLLAVLSKRIRCLLSATDLQ